MTFTSDLLPDVMPIYYKRLFPYQLFYRWLSYGDPKLFSHREMSFTLPGDVYIRYQSFDRLDDFEKELIKKCPEKIDIGGVYNWKPKMKRTAGSFEVEEKELVFDIDMTDYDNVRTCCSEADVCPKCWKFMGIATKILDAALREDFGFKHLLWVFSGRRGIHCWVCDDLARKMDQKVRSDLAEYLQILTKEDAHGKIAHVPPEKMHPSIRRAVDFIRNDFSELIAEGQDIIGTPERCSKFLQFIEDDALKQEVTRVWEGLTTSKDRWDSFVTLHQRLNGKGQLKRRSKYLVEELMLHYAYPRLDINVSKGLNHLLKSPFCVHPKTGKICAPFNPANAFKFNPNSVPSVSDLIDEIASFDEKENQANEAESRRKVKDIKKTSMYKGIQVFEEFVRGLEEDSKAAKKDDPEKMVDSW